MRFSYIRLLLVLLLTTFSYSVFAQNKINIDVPIEKVILSYAESSNEKFVIDPRVKGKVRLLGQELSSLSLDDLNIILEVHNFAAVRVGDYWVVVPGNITRNMAIRTVQKGETYSAAEQVSDVIHLSKLCPQDLVPVLRPLLSPTSHFGPEFKSRSIVITGSYANTQKIRSIIAKIESNVSKKSSCQPEDTE